MARIRRQAREVFHRAKISKNGPSKYALCRRLLQGQAVKLAPWQFTSKNGGIRFSNDEFSLEKYSIDLKTTINTAENQHHYDRAIKIAKIKPRQPQSRAKWRPKMSQWPRLRNDSSVQNANRLHVIKYHNKNDNDLNLNEVSAKNNAKRTRKKKRKTHHFHTHQKRC